ncbi:MAG: PD-(D/E)XK nuclease family protein [Anaerolineae bacterium]
MTLPETFRFSQRSLQDYADCARRFQLRYLLMQPWPALITDSPQAFEEHVARGADFHRLAHQHALGIDAARLAETIDDESLARWWQIFLSRPPAGLPETVRRAEVVLTAPAPGPSGPEAGPEAEKADDAMGNGPETGPRAREETGPGAREETGPSSLSESVRSNGFSRPKATEAATTNENRSLLRQPARAGEETGQGAGYRLVAKFDLLAAEPGERLVVVDWKTVLKQPRRQHLVRRLQTTVYRYLAVEAGADYFGGQRPGPEQVEMVYWFANHGGAVERFPYDAAQHAVAREELAGMVAEIDARQETIWPLTSDERHCRFCNYRSLCERGVRAGFLEDLEEDVEPAEIEINLEQIAEVEF